jgi:hypothetical protein
MCLVECHSDQTCADRPVALYWQSQRLEVVVILSSWHTPQVKHFLVRTTQNQVFALFYSEYNNTWDVASQ